MRSTEGPASGDSTLEPESLVKESAHEFGSALAFGIDAGRIERIGRAGIGLGQMRYGGRLLAIDSPGTGEKKSRGAMAGGELKSALRASQDGRQHINGSFGGLPCAGLVCGVNYEGKIAIGEGEVANVADKEGDGGISNEVGALRGKGDGVASEDGGVSVKVEGTVDMGKALDQPAAEKASAPG